MSTKRKQKLLTFGYVREQYRYSIPFVLTHVIHSFHDEYHYWNIKGNQLTEFFNAENGAVLYGEPFFINDIEFQCTLCPNGYRNYAAGAVQFYAEIKHLPSYIENVTFYTELSCETTQTFCRALINHRKSRAGIGWNHHELKRADLKQLNLKSIEFHCKVELRYIKFKPVAKPTAITDEDALNGKEAKPSAKPAADSQSMQAVMDRYYIRQFPMWKQSQFVWKIDQKLIEQCVSLRDGQRLFSPVFDGVWAARLYKVNGCQIRLHLGCMAYPKDVHGLRVQYRFCHRLKKEKKKWSEQMVDDRNAVNLWTNSETEYVDIAKLQSVNAIASGLLVWIEVNVLKLYGENGAEIDSSEYEKYLQV